jgi:hypothetical protein
MSIVLLGSTSGSCTLQEQAVAGTTTLTLPTFNGTVGLLVSGTAVASTSGTSIDFTSIPAGVRRITVMFDGVSVSSTSSFLVQLGDSGGIENTGYNGGGARFANASINALPFTNGFSFNNVTPSCLYSGNLILCNLSGNTWSASGVLGGSAIEFQNTTGGSKTLSATLDRVRITTTGADTFDAGSINILYE